MSTACSSMKTASGLAISETARTPTPAQLCLKCAGCCARVGVTEATRLSEMGLAGCPDKQRHYEPLCDLILYMSSDGDELSLHSKRDLTRIPDMRRFDREYSNYRRTLDLERAVHTVEYQKADRHVRREAFISYPDRVMALRCAGEHFRAVLSRGAYMHNSIMPDANTIALTGRTSADGIRYAVAVRALGCDVRRLGETLICSGDTVLLVATATDFRYDDPLREVYARLNTAEARGYEALLDAHVADITRFTRRCGLRARSRPRTRAHCRPTPASSGCAMEALMPA